LSPGAISSDQISIDNFHTLEAAVAAAAVDKGTTPEIGSRLQEVAIDTHQTAGFDN